MVAVVTQHNDNFRTGANLEEAELDWKTVSVNSFGKVNEFRVKGQIWAQPLFVSSVQVPDRGPTNLVIVATSENEIHAFDADTRFGDGSSPVWSFPAGLAVPSRAFDPGYGDMYRASIGILGTPVIDVSIAKDGTVGGTIFAVAMIWNAAAFEADPERAFSHDLVAVDLATGLPRNRACRTQIGGMVEGSGYLASGEARRDGERIVREAEIAADLTSIMHPMSGAKRRWPVTDAVQRNGRDHVVFNSMMQLQRPGLLLQDGIIYSAFGAHADQDPYHGWVFAHAADTLEPRGVFCTSRNGRRAGVWQAGEGISADRSGHIYVGTGNGDISPAAGCFGDSLLKLRLAGSGLELAGFSNAFEELSNEDEDFGASSPTIINERYMAGGGKDGHFYLFDQGALTASGDPGATKQLFIASYDKKSKDEDEQKRKYTHHIHGSPPVYSNGHKTYLYVWGENDFLRAFEFDPRQGIFPRQPNKRGEFGEPDALGDVCCSEGGPHDSMHGGFLSVSADGTQPRTGIVWASFPAFDNASQAPVEGELRAFRADTFERGRLVTLWSSRCNLDRDDVGCFTKFCCPTIANGRVFLPSFEKDGKLNVFGLLNGEDGGYDMRFGGKSGLVFNGNAGVRSGRLRIVEAPHPSQAGSIFYREKVAISGFRTRFRFRSRLPDRFDDHQHPEAHGLTFTIQKQSAHALGESGSGLGYGPDFASDLSRGRKIDGSFAIGFGLRNSILGFYFDGDVGGGGSTVRPAGTNLRDETLVEIEYDGDARVMTVLCRDCEAGFELSHRFEVDLVGRIAEDAWVGFTAGSGQSACTIDILEWDFMDPAQDVS